MTHAAIIDWPLVIATTEDPDMLAARYGDDCWDIEAQLAEIEYRRLMSTDTRFAQMMGRARLAVHELAR